MTIDRQDQDLGPGKEFKGARTAKAVPAIVAQRPLAARMEEMSRHIGNHFDEFLGEEGLLAEAEAIAAKRVIAFQLAKRMNTRTVTKAQLAKRMGASRSALERLLHPNNPSVTVLKLECAPQTPGAA